MIIAVKAGFLRSVRTPYRRSCHNPSTKDSQPAERTTSFVPSRFPRSKRTVRSASLRLIPSFIFSSAAISRKPFSSSSNSLLTRSFRNSDRSPLAIFRSNDIAFPLTLRRLQDSGDRRHLPSPFSRFAVEPLSSLLGQGVVLCAPAVLGRFPFALDQSIPLQPLKSDKQRTCIESENALAHLFEPHGDPISVHGFERQRFQNEHVQRALDEITGLVPHRRLPPENQVEEYTSPTDCQEEKPRQGFRSLRRHVFAELRESDARLATATLLELVPQELVVHLVVELHLGDLHHRAERTRAAIRVHAGVQEQANVVAMREDAVHEVPAKFAELLLALRIPEQVLALLADGNVSVHATPIHSDHRLRQEA